ncbi:hypothetical protein HY640_01335 [Candidatus Woesearchaeota archaeon]|nr:hypothetical protein [Candidatus Woesearchaeota archaeon]
MKRAILFLTLMVALASAYAHDTGIEHPEPKASTANLSSRNLTLTNASSAQPEGLGGGSVKNDAKCSSEYECRIASQHEKTFWFGCYFDNSDGMCRCFKGDLSQCNISRSSVSLDDWCAYQFECVKRSDENYQFNCYFDQPSSQCRCFVGELSQCRGDKSLLNKAALMEDERRMSEGRKPAANASLITVTGEAVKSPEDTSTLAERLEVIARKPIFLLSAAAMIAILILVGIMLFRETPASDLSHARKFHRKAEQLHEKGEESESHRYYQLAEEYRAKARKLEDE